MGSSRIARSWHGESATWNQLEQMYSKMMQDDGAEIEPTTVVTLLSYFFVMSHVVYVVYLHTFALYSPSH